LRLKAQEQRTKTKNGPEGTTNYANFTHKHIIQPRIVDASLFFRVSRFFDINRPPS